jgi:hypothetical protein
MPSVSPIRYVWSVKKHFDFSKSQLQDYAVPKKKIEDIFSGTTGFVKKYSKKPPKNLLSTEIRVKADEDASDLRDKIEKRLIDQGLEKRKIEKVLYELPDGEDLTSILLSYRIHDTEDKMRVRIPLNSAIREHDVVAKETKIINNVHVNTNE